MASPDPELLITRRKHQVQKASLLSANYVLHSMCSQKPSPLILDIPEVFVMLEVKKSTIGISFCPDTGEKQNTIFSSRKARTAMFFEKSVLVCGPYGLHKVF